MEDTKKSIAKHMFIITFFAILIDDITSANISLLKYLILLQK